ncbi:MAG: GGDEF domain-containing protein [Planctomycetes bacterium]|jgi:diguanylate cyclase (GGDEF)-like protein|nr:GGDEF domain-containing protein [Planctomycetota bacterium]MBT4028636.1 GGDEF domain-containing protein [Planctomycetota bacterium]MBT4559528.1 GGDEF domain-containing protein [Planctomycetota bacterium]MBT7011602.1 GGDEF domain-containing protein [Planctomycetota bacterium]MBT7318945.1 GGDEF domain-containing protein [Planctomycetota bacterium]
MFQRVQDRAAGPRTLAILNHRGAALEELRRWFQDRGWEVRVSRTLDDTLQLLSTKELTAAIVAPLTLLPEGLEWSELFGHLSPTTALPWLLLPYESASPGLVTNLLRGREALADWADAKDDLPRQEARMMNLLRLDRLLAESRTRAAALEGQLITDHKTGLFNDRHFRRRLREEFERTQRHGSPLTMVLLDLDDFKSINDSTSYEFGDLALRTTGEILRQSTRSIDIAARIGGDEFALLLPSTTLEEGVAVCRRIHAMSQHQRVSNANHTIMLGMSLGIATYDGHGLQDQRQLFLRANEALKSAKISGKGRVGFFDPQSQKAVAPKENEGAASSQAAASPKKKKGKNED